MKNAYALMILQVKPYFYLNFYQLKKSLSLQTRLDLFSKHFIFYMTFMAIKHLNNMTKAK